VDGGHPTIDTFLIRPRFWKKVAQHGRIIEDALYSSPSTTVALENVHLPTTWPRVWANVSQQWVVTS